jgi:hypothetical protein
VDGRGYRGACACIDWTRIGAAVPATFGGTGWGLGACRRSRNWTCATACSQRWGRATWTAELISASIRANAQRRAGCWLWMCARARDHGARSLCGRLRVQIWRWRGAEKRRRGGALGRGARRRGSGVKDNARPRITRRRLDVDGAVGFIREASSWRRRRVHEAADASAASAASACAGAASTAIIALCARARSRRVDLAPAPARGAAKEGREVRDAVDIERLALRWLGHRAAQSHRACAALVA